MDVLMPPNRINWLSWDSHRIYSCRKYSSLSFHLFSYSLFCVAQLAHCHYHLLSPTLSAPIYFFSHLLGLHRCLLHIRYHPKLITDLLYQRRTISLGGCLTCASCGTLPGGGLEIIISSLWRMTATYYLQASCTRWPPCDRGLCQLLVVVAWTRRIIHATVQIIFMVNLTFSGTTSSIISCVTSFHC